MPDLTRAALASCLALGLAGCVSSPGPVEPYPFVGSWDCGGDVFTFTETSWTSGRQTLPIRNVSRDGRNYTLMFPGNYLIALAAVTDSGMTFVSGKTGDQRVCLRRK